MNTLTKTKLLAFHGDKKLKKFYVDRVRGHELADEIIHGKYWENGRGCGVGCTIHSGDHKAYPVELGIPVWLAKVEDSLFERMDNGNGKTFPRRFLQAIKPGVDCNEALYPYLSLVVESVLPFAGDKTRPAIQGVLSLLQDRCTDKDKLLATRAAAGAVAAGAIVACDAAAAAAADAIVAAAADAIVAAAADAIVAAAAADYAIVAAAASSAAAAYAATAACDAADYAADAAADYAADAVAAGAKHASFLADGLIDILTELKPVQQYSSCCAHHLGRKDAPQ